MNLFKDLGVQLGKNNGVFSVECLQQGWGVLQYRKDILGGDGIPCSDGMHKTGFGTHAPSRVRIILQKKVRSFHAVCGTLMDAHMKVLPDAPEKVFSVEADGKSIFTTGPMKFREIRTIDVPLPENTRFFDLVVDGPLNATHAAWADTQIGFADGNFEDPSEPGRKISFLQDCPVSFDYDGKTSAELFQEKPPVWTIEKTDNGEIATIVWTGDSLRMKCVITRYEDFPVAEWHTEFDNPSGKRSGRLHNVRVLNAYINEHRQLLRRRGSFNDPLIGEGLESFTNSFKPEMAAPSEDRWTFGGYAGRPSDNWLPCFDLIGKQDDIRFVIGWAGQWIAQLHATTCSFNVEAGMEDLDTVLEAGEHISQPSVFMQYTKDGQEPYAANVWRRFVLKHVMMDTPDKAPLSLMHWGGMDENSQMDRLADLEKHQIPYDVFWIDAGWFAEKSTNEHTPVWSSTVGDWKFDKDSYPNQMKEISKRVHKTGHKFLLWFEPERVIRDRDLAKEHPEYLIPDPANSNNTLLDLGNPEAWNWCRKTIGKIIEDNNIDWYREDFNFGPLEYWRSKDAPDRKGMTELRFTEGLYRFWKDLRESYPDLLIDNCSSGGRRLDIELLRYSIPLWYSDMQCFADFNPDYSLVQTEGLSHYLPVFGGGIQNAAGGDTYNFRANFNPGIGVHYFYSDLEPVNDAYPREWLKKMLTEYMQVRDVMSGDFYSLSESSRLSDKGTWTIFQYVRYDASKSAVLAFRPPESPVLKYQVIPRGISAEANYRVYDMDGFVPEQTLSGRDLLEKGFPLELAERRSSAVVVLEKE